MAGYGARSSVGGNLGANLGTGRLRQGDNRYDFRFGDSDFGGFWDGFFGTADNQYTYVSDFDNGLAANDVSCNIAASSSDSAVRKYCNLGRGAGRSRRGRRRLGRPGLHRRQGGVDQLVRPDVRRGFRRQSDGCSLNSSFGEFSGYVPVFLHRDFIVGSLPEPGTLALFGARPGRARLVAPAPRRLIQSS